MSQRGVSLAAVKARNSRRTWRFCARALIVGALLSPSVFYAVTALTWDREGRARVTGDEPHYLIVSDAIVRDHSLDVRRAYGAIRPVTASSAPTTGRTT